MLTILLLLLLLILIIIEYQHLLHQLQHLLQSQVHSAVWWRLVRVQVSREQHSVS